MTMMMMHEYDNDDDDGDYILLFHLSRASPYSTSCKIPAIIEDLLMDSMDGERVGPGAMAVLGHVTELLGRMG
jgi:hypothetical protein